MKTKNVINSVVFALAIIGVFFKHMHWPGASIILVLSYLCLLYLLFMYTFTDNKESGLGRFLNSILIGALALFIFTLWFKSMHWPGAQILSIASTLIVLATTGVIVFSKEGVTVSKQYVFILFMFILLLDGLLHRTGWSKLPGVQNLEQKIDVAIAPTKMNVLYMGIDNPLAVVASGIDNSKLEVKSDNGTLTGEKGSYVANPKDAEKLTTIQVFADGKEIGKVSFRVKLVPEPAATVAGMGSGTSISLALFLEQKGVVAELPDFAFDLTFTITEFTVVATEGIYSMSVSTKGDQFTQEQLDLIKKVKKGSRVTIEDIKAVGPDGQIRDLKPIVFKIK